MEGGQDLHATHAGRAAFVAATARELLEGHARRAVTDLRAHMRARDDDNPAPGLQRAAAAYLEAKQPYLNDHIALALGWPIAAGVRRIMPLFGKDRLDITGARWSLNGAEAILLLRTVIATGDIDTYWQFHLNRDHRRIHASLYKDQFTMAA